MSDSIASDSQYLYNKSYFSGGTDTNGANQSSSNALFARRPVVIFRLDRPRLSASPQNPQPHAHGFMAVRTRVDFRARSNFRLAGWTEYCRLVMLLSPH